VKCFLIDLCVKSGFVVLKYFKNMCFDYLKKMHIKVKRICVMLLRELCKAFESFYIRGMFTEHREGGFLRL